MGGKNKKQTVGYHYRPAYHVGLGRGPIDAFLAFAAADKIAWDGSQQYVNRITPDSPKYKKSGIIEEVIPPTGPVTSSERIYIGAPDLFGGEKDQGGIDGPVDIMFGEADQMPNEYLRSVFGDQVAAWRGLATLAFCGGRFGAMNPMPQKPSYKIRKILKGWDGDDCWYPERAEIALSSISEPYDGIWAYRVEAPGSGADYSAADYDHSDWETGPGGFGSFSPPGSTLSIGTFVPGQIGKAIWIRRNVHFAGNVLIDIFHDDGAWLWVNGAPIALESLQYFHSRAVVNMTGDTVVALKVIDGTPAGTANIFAGITFNGGDARVLGMNPAHSLYYVRTDGEKGREPRGNMNDASLRAAADKLYREGFGLCWHYDPERDTPDSFTERVCRIIGGSFERSLLDGQWYLDLARSDYVVSELYVVGDDDILSFKELPTTLERAVNSISVRYLDPEKNETIITPPIRALGLVRQFGETHEVLDFPEIPDGRLALRVAERELRARCTPIRTFELTVTPRLRGLRRNQYFRLQSARRRIADMVCIVGEKQVGTLRSGAMRLVVSQDVYSLPGASYAEIEEGVDTRPPDTPLPIEHARVFEAPYIDVCAILPRAELEALPTDVGFLIGVASSPASGIDYAMCVQDQGGEYSLATNADWGVTATVADAYVAEIGPTAVSLSNGSRLENASVGMAVLWDDELCRLDALDLEMNQATLARGCADTVSSDHAAGSRLWFVGSDVAIDTTEYTDGEAVNVKMLSSTGGKQFPLSLAAPILLEFSGRQARPYVAASLRVNGELAPLLLDGDLHLTWSHRDRLLQADQLFDQAASSIGPEIGTTYTIRTYLEGTLVETQDGISGDSATVRPGGNGRVRIELEAVRNGLISWQRQVLEFDYTTGPTNSRVTVGGDRRVTVLGNGRTTIG